MELFSLQGKLAVVTGGGGILGAAMAKGLATAGAKVAVADLDETAAKRTAATIAEEGGTARGSRADAMKPEELVALREAIRHDLGVPDILVSAVGGNVKDATTSETVSFFDLPLPALERVVALNLFAGAILPAQVFGREMAAKPEGASIINISSMNAFRPLTKVVGYSAAKAAVSNFTQWLAVHLAQNYSPKIRVNAIAPGFFLTTQNRFLLTDEKTGELTPRGHAIIDHTPMGRFGTPEDLVGTVIWLASPASSFVTGVVIPVDGGFSAFSGV
ncbi:MAG: SDR family oxidoreductase [Firmicutes bacterium]|nr:SDR family oxidoreductase [Bacillota bacterium]